MRRQRDRMKDRMKEHYADPKNRETHQHDMKESMSSKSSQGSLESEDNNEIYGAEEKLLASLNVKILKLAVSMQYGIVQVFKVNILIKLLCV